jgi:hypothetical protein
MWFRSLWEEFESLQMEATEVPEGYKQSLRGDSNGSSDANRNTDSKDYAPKVSDRNKHSIRDWTRSHLWYIMAENLSTYCLVS